MKRSLIDCLTKQCLLSFSLSRRHLAAQPVRKPSLSSDPSPAPTLTPQRQIQTPVTAPISDIGLKRHAPVPSSPVSELPLPQDDPEDLSQSPSPYDFLDPEAVHPMPHLPAPSPKQRSDYLQTIIIAVVVTAAVTFTLAAFCFCCCNRYAGSKYQTVNGRKDERPILSLSLSDFSGSSQNSFGLYEEKFGSSFKTDPSQRIQLWSFATAEGRSVTSSEVTNAPHNPSPPAAPPPPPLRPPPGKTSAPPPAPPPPLPKPKTAPPPPRGPPPPKGSRFLSQASSSSSAKSHLVQSDSSKANVDADGAKAKLKPFFWDKVTTNPDQSMVWHQLKTGSFQ